MLLTAIESDKYKFIYNYDKFTIYSNIDSNILALEKFPIYTEDYNDYILNKILDPNILKFICNNQKVLAIALVGSRSIGIVDQWSDYDLLVITDDNNIYKNNKLDCYIIYNNEIGIHWYQYSKNLLFDLQKPKAILEFCSFWQLPQEKFIAVWDLDFIEQLKKFIAKIADTACIAFYNNIYKSTLNQVLEAKTLPQTKLLYHLCVVSHFLEKTEMNYKFLNELKRINYIKISEDCKNYCIERIKLLKKIVDKNTVC